MNDNELNPQSLERVARFLDGEEIALSAEERLLASQVDCDQRALAGSLDHVEIPAGALDAVRRRSRAAVLVPRRSVARVVSWSAAAAAAVLLAALWVAQYTKANYGSMQPQIVKDIPNVIAPAVDSVADNEADKAAVVALMATDTEDLNLAIEQSSLENILDSGPNR